MTDANWGRRTRTIGRVAVWALGGFLILCVFALGWVGVRGVLAAVHLDQIRTKAPELVSSFTADPSQAVDGLRALSDHTQAAHDLTSDPIWAVVAHTPWIGPQLQAVSTVTSSADELLRLGVLPLAESTQAGVLDALKPVNGRIDTSSLSSMKEPAGQAAAHADNALTAIKHVDRTPLVGKLGDAVDQSEGLFSRAAGALDALSTATQLLPGMLGESGPRSYLVLVQNNAEMRSLGGIAGTSLLLRTDAGGITLVGTESGTALSAGIRGPVTTLPEDVQAVYGTRPARYFQNLTQVPDFTFDGPLARDMYQQLTGNEVDGVLAIDPVVLSYLLKATGPIVLPDGSTINADNAASLFLSEVYKRYPDPTTQDAFFAASSASIFTAFIEGRGSSTGLLTALARGADERRVLLWSAYEDEQALLDGSSMAGKLPVTDDDTARFGVYFNDAAGSKMSYYLKPDVSLAWSGCGIPGQPATRQLTLTVNLMSSAPADAARSLPLYVTANGLFGVAPGIVALTGNVYLPQGYTLVSAQASSGASFTSAGLQGREVLSYGVNLQPGQTDSISVVVETTSAATDAEAIVTPTADQSISPVVAAMCESVATATLK
ncbi:DUF4012 domain-containing protein [Microbacterium sp. BH-3-3-3]|uniref:DUF4012 domain-containing protein n=1 Tax=Microbacterium sp. BH-3-3-3 TaxID=1906742 RepID=UPI00119E0438|nr:DUF4012 domain-containing protein [Microbacterium sp. BH-3-3-3]